MGCTLQYEKLFRGEKEVFLFLSVEKGLSKSTAK